MDSLHMNGTNKSFDGLFYRQWFAHNWHISIYASVIYMICVSNGQKWMKSRQAYDLKTLIFCWNLCLSFFSFWGASVLLPELWSSVRDKGLFYSICDNSFKNEPTLEYWMWLFTWSKLIELGDTVFIVLRKQKLICLHWTHHIITLIYCFVVYSELPAISRWGYSINYMIHTIMYFYYALKVIKVAVPLSVSKLITSLQTVQMLVGVVTSSSALYYRLKGHMCDGTVPILLATIAMALYYFVLFAHYYINRYINRNSKSSTDRKAE